MKDFLIFCAVKVYTYKKAICMNYCSKILSFSGFALRFQGFVHGLILTNELSSLFNTCQITDVPAHTNTTTIYSVMRYV